LVDVISYTEITGDVILVGDIIANNFIVGSTNLITEITDIQGRLNIEEPKISSLESITSSLATQISEIELTPGPKGDAGSIGATGAKGDAGAIGATGAKGDAGEIGATGTKGDAGAIGATGAKGDTGTTGATGPQGIDGNVATINDGDLTIAKTDGLQSALDSKQSTLTLFSNIAINKVSTLSDITGGNLLYMDNSGTKNVKTEFSATNSAINLKQNQINFLTDLTCATLSSSNLNVTGNSTVGPILNIGINDASTTPKTIYFGGLNGDNEYSAGVIESRIFSGTENSELLIFKGNDVNQDRIRLRAGVIHFDTNATGNNDRTAESIRMTISAAGRVGIGTTIPTRALQVVGDIYCTGTMICDGYSVSSAKPRMRITRSNFTIPSGTTSLLNGGSVGLQSNCTVTAGVFIATIAGIYACSCKLRLPDNNNQSPEIQWYKRAGSGQQSSYEDFEGWIPAGVNGRRAGMSHTIISLGVGDGVLPRNDLETMAGCTATFDVFMIQ
jgi:hypothetical protein